jgi:hypothetical protein
MTIKSVQRIIALRPPSRCLATKPFSTSRGRRLSRPRNSRRMSDADGFKIVAIMPLIRTVWAGVVGGARLSLRLRRHHDRRRWSIHSAGDRVSCQRRESVSAADETTVRRGTRHVVMEFSSLVFIVRRAINWILH